LQNQTYIRRANKNDQAAVADLAVVNGMFAIDEVEGLTDAFRSAFNGDLDGHQWFVATTQDDVVAAAYLAPEPFADRLWNLYFIAVHPSQHGAGIGTALIAHLENVLRDKGEAEARVLLVETSSTDQYGATRAFYMARGFDREAQIREFYGPGDHKVVFWKAIAD
jgi:ribosomal protein S18 acetylase RimI-like enzyme